MEQLQPRSYSYKLFSISDDPRCIQPFKEVHGVQRPKEPNTEGKSEEEAVRLKEEHCSLVKTYKKELMTPLFAENYLNTHCESPVPNTLVVIEEYDRLLAATLHQLGPHILDQIKVINNGDDGRMIPCGRIRAKVMVVDGSDGFADLKIISNKESRELSSHGITMDFTLISVSVEHKLGDMGDDMGDVEDVENRSNMSGGSIDEEEDEEEQLSQVFSQMSSISDVSSSTATQSSAVTLCGGGLPDKSDDEFSLVFDEKKPNSSYVSRPIFR